MKGLFFFEFVGLPGGSPKLGKGNPGWVPSQALLIKHVLFANLGCCRFIFIESRSLVLLAE